ncbi:hypothetical protein MJO55_09005 [Mycolicibacterium rufum]|uniref:Uncharacterized protein n=1 Tax=Mycolicibacterium rufum TaxID=318424 RepID=A0A9X2YEW0_9MYCO|nr:hypothetical protein [Mycolicibacterium rufum]MCV7071406.1 hypothetical protein [Mycolicibacterium rufum]ULP38534.1 hypothetical protein MJO55_09005 [Mycolicibacterium rufum]
MQTRAHRLGGNKRRGEWNEWEVGLPKLWMRVNCALLRASFDDIAGEQECNSRFSATVIAAALLDGASNERGGRPIAGEMTAGCVTIRPGARRSRLPAGSLWHCEDRIVTARRRRHW